jgi:glucose/arabinose dehydrogenase
MPRRRLRHALVLALAGGFALSCSFLPERCAVNAPILNSLFGRSVGAPEASTFARRIRVPEGFGITVYAEVPRARFLRPTPTGDLLVSVPREGEVVLLERDADGDGRADGRRVLLADLDRPHGLDLHEGWLYVAEGSAVGRIRFDPERRSVAGTFERVVTGLPEGGNHWTRTVRIGPDGWMYVTLGSSCNVCVEEDERRAAMLRFRPDGSQGEVYARGLRNAVGFDWRPGTSELYATDNGRDLLGDDFPPCELNRVVRGGDYGWPVANGDRVVDPDLGAGHEARARASLPPVHGFGAHTAPLGITFLRGSALPDGYREAALVALHGSWNRTRKSGYEVVSLHWKADGSIEERDFVTGFLENEDVIGRPVDVAEASDGAIYVSDDYAGVVYQVKPGGAGASVAGRGRAGGGRDDGLSAFSSEERALRAARGAGIYEANACASCHEAEKARPGTVVKPLVDLADRYDVTSLARFFTSPTPPMPLVPLTAEERTDLAVHLLDAERAATP